MKRLSSLWSIENIKVVRRVIVSVVGATVLLIGVALLVLPGPAFIVIPLGLAILATEYAWARRWLKKFVKWRPMLFRVAAAQHAKLQGLVYLGAGRVNQSFRVSVTNKKLSCQQRFHSRDPSLPCARKEQ